MQQQPYARNLTRKYSGLHQNIGEAGNWGAPGLIALRSIAPLRWHVRDAKVAKNASVTSRGAMERSAISPGTPRRPLSPRTQFLSGKKTPFPPNGHRPKYSSILMISGLVLILLLLITCGNVKDTNSTNTTLATPPVDIALKKQGNIQLQTFQQWITLMKQYNGNTSPYQGQYNRDQRTLQSAITPKLYKKALTALKAHVIAIQMPAMKVEGQQLQQQLTQQVTAWSQHHQFHNSFDNKDYPLGYEYGDNGIGSWVQNDLAAGKTLADLQQTIEDLHMYLYNFQAMTENATDNVPYNALHQTDLKLMQHDGKTNGKVIIVSLHEQAMRVYEDGKLVNAFLVTTGRPDRPTPPGNWWIEGKESPTIFKSGVPEGSPNWYPDTPINYAMQYHSNGYFIHDSWWRDDYGPGTNFPHNDSSGDTFSAQGSHGCVNLSKDNAGWLYGFVDLYTSIIIY